jgi:ABC-type uncharacterized transport system permease subunit
VELFTDRHVFLLAVLVYGLSMSHSVFLWRKGFRRDDHVNYLLLLIGFALHTTAMLLRGFSVNRCPVRNLFEATLFVMWGILAVYLVLGLLPRLRFIGAFASPVLFGLGVFALMPALDKIHGDQTEFSGGWLSLHVTLFALAYAAFGLSAVAGMMFLTQANDLKFNKLRAIASLMPPLQRLDFAAGRLLLAGFILLTLALGVSIAWSKNLGKIQPTDPKVIWSWLVWLMYLALALMRWKFAQTGRRFARGAIGAFVFVLLTFWGSSLLSPLHHP